MELSTVLSAMNRLEIDTANLSPESRLGQDVGMDSQEIVELRGILNQECKVRLPAGRLKKDSSIQDVVNLIRELAMESAPVRPEHHKSGFAHFCETREIIAREVPVVYEALFRLEKWDKLLPHVKSIEVLYDDGMYQEFRMGVSSPSGLLKVRSVRRCDEGAAAIDFFQPEPPAYLKHHSGGWRLKALEGGRCEVYAFHHWNLNEEVAARTFQQSGPNYEEQAKTVLLGHARFALSCWKQILETGTLPTLPQNGHA